MYFILKYFLNLLILRTITILSEHVWELVPWANPDPNTVAYLRQPISHKLDLDSSVFNCESCFLFVSLFNDIDFTYHRTPIYLTRLHPVGIKHRPTSLKHVPKNLAAEVTKEESLIVSSLNQSKICLSKFFHISDNICSHITLDAFIGKSKPWNFQQFVYLLPSNKLDKLHTIWEHNITYQNNQFLDNVVGIVISIEELNNIIWPLLTDHLNRVQVELSTNENVLLFHLFLETLEERDQTLVIILPFTWLALWAVRWIHISIYDYPYSLSVTEIQHLCNKQLVATKNISLLGTNLYSRSSEYECSDEIRMNKISPINTIHHNLMCLKTKIVLQYLAGQNFRISSQYVNAMPRIDLKSFAGYDVDSMLFVASHPLTQTRYIACGEKFDESHINYNIFLASFEYEVWIALVILLFIIVPIEWYLFSLPKYLGFKNSIVSFCRGLGVVGKIFLEQSVPLTSKHLRNVSLKIIVGVTIICALVLNNTYKNDNMYEMMLPKIFRPIETFEQLVDSKFLVYSLPTLAQFYRPNLSNGTLKTRIRMLDKHSAFIMVDNQTLASLRSEFKDLNKEFDSIKTKMFEIVYNNSELWLKPLDKIGKIFVDITLSYSRTVDWKGMVFLMNGNSTTEITVLKELELCNNTAFLAMENKIAEWEIILRHKGVKKVSIGKQILVRKSIGYKIKGWLPVFIYDRISGLKTSGIIEWWNKIISGHLASVLTNLKTLSGSGKKLNEYLNTSLKNTDEFNSRPFFLVFYLVLAMGCLAFICFVLEFAYSFRRQIRSKLGKFFFAKT